MSYAYLFKYIIIGDTGMFEPLSHALFLFSSPNQTIGGNDLPFVVCDPGTNSFSAD